MDLSKFKSLLDEQMAFPDYYQFKFVVKSDKKENVLELLEGYQVSEKQSKTGKYTSISARKIMNSSDEIIEVYERLSKVKGVITL